MEKKIVLSEERLDDLPPAVPLYVFLLAAAMVGILTAVAVLPAWLPGMSGSLQGNSPRAYWYLARTSGFVAYILLWLSMALGLIITNRMARVWPGGPAAFDLHQYISLLGLGFALFHGIILLGDRYMNYTPLQMVIPFAAPGATLAVGLGQVSFYLLAMVAWSFYVRQRIGRQIWRQIHYSSFAVFLLALGHGLWSGTDTHAGWASMVYWISAGSILFLTIYRILIARMAQTGTQKDRPAAQALNH